MMSTWRTGSENCRRREDQGRTLGTLRHLDPQRRRERSVKTHDVTVVAAEPQEIEIRPARGDFTGIVEQRGIDESIDHDAPFRLNDETVLVAEAVAGESSKRGSTSNVRQQEERDLLI